MRFTQNRLHLVGPAVLAAVAIAVASPAVSVAEAVWDIGEYDSCTRQLGGRPGSESDPIAQELENQRWCCHISDGVWTEAQGCVAPPAEGADLTAPSGPKVDLPTVAVQPPIMAPSGSEVREPIEVRGPIGAVS